MFIVPMIFACFYLAHDFFQVSYKDKRNLIIGVTLIASFCEVLYRGGQMMVLGVPFGAGFGPILLITDSLLNIYAILLLWRTNFKKLPIINQEILTVLKWVILLCMPGILFDVFSPMMFSGKYFMQDFQFSYLFHFIISVIIIKKVFDYVTQNSFQSNSKNILEMATHYGFTERETEILSLLRRGLSNKVMAKKLFVSDLTVKKHLQNMYFKAGVKSRYELMGGVTEGR